MPTAAKMSNTAYFGVKVTEFTLGEKARQRRAAPTAANTPSPLTPPKRSCGSNPRDPDISTPGRADQIIGTADGFFWA